MLWVQDLSIHLMRIVDFFTKTKFDTIWFTYRCTRFLVYLDYFTWFTFKRVSHQNICYPKIELSNN